MKLDENSIGVSLRSIPSWTRAGDTIRREFSFADFSEAFAFMTRVALLAEQAGHHPDWRNVWNKVTIELSTHDAGGLTSKDFLLASAIDRVAATS